TVWNSTMAVMCGWGRRRSGWSRSRPARRAICCASPGTSATGTCRYKRWRAGCASATTMSSPRWSRGWADVSPGCRRRSIRKPVPMPAPSKLWPTGMTTEGLYRLLAWASPAFPTGGFSYSHGLETAAADGMVHNRATLEAWIVAVVVKGSGRIDADILRDAYRAAAGGDDAALAAANRRGVAYRATSELAVESGQQGAAFVAAYEAAWAAPHPNYLPACGEIERAGAYSPRP